MVCRTIRIYARVTAVILTLIITHGTTHAAAVTWEFQGTTTFRQGSDSLPLNVGDPVRVLVHFETDGPYTNRPSSNNRPGFRYEYACQFTAI